MPHVTMFGIKNCDTVKKARTWLERHGIAYDFHDYKAQGIDRRQLEAWIGSHGWETVLNRAGQTFRKLPDATRANVTEKQAVELMLAQPSMIKRPIVEVGGASHVGFSAERYQALFG
jgi:arsenate reductase (glutaredoxin)